MSSDGPSKVPIKVILGLGMVGDRSKDPLVRFDTPEEVRDLLNLFYDRGYRELDSARNYSPNAPGSAEPRIYAAQAGAGGPDNRFLVDSKVLSFLPGTHTAANIAASVADQLRDLHLDRLHIDYLHGPDPVTDLAETLAAMDKHYGEHKFEKLGVSNYDLENTQAILDLAQKNGWVRPAVYQGHYNFIKRGMEPELLPLLRQNNMAYYAYSPAAGGFFKDADRSRFNPEGNFAAALYSAHYEKPVVEQIAAEVKQQAAKHGITAHAAALRWVAHHSALSGEHGDGIVLGVSSLQQLSDNLDALEAGPLPQELLVLLDSVFEKLPEEDKALPAIGKEGGGSH